MKTLVRPIFRPICSLVNHREPSVSSRTFNEVSTMGPLPVHLHRSIYFLLFRSSFHQLASLRRRTRGKCAFSKKLNALEVPSPPPNPANLHSTLNPASDFQHLSPSFHTNIRISQCCCSTKIFTTQKNGSEGTTFCRIRLFYFKMQHVPPLSLR